MKEKKSNYSPFAFGSLFLLQVYTTSNSTTTNDNDKEGKQEEDEAKVKCHKNFIHQIFPH